MFEQPFLVYPESTEEVLLNDTTADNFRWSDKNNISNISNETQHTDRSTNLDNYPVSEDTPYAKDRLTEAQENPIFNDFIPSVNIFNKFVEINKKTLEILPNDFNINTENIICPLYPLCLYNSSEITDIFNHILQFHNTVLPFNFDKTILINEDFKDTVSLFAHRNIINYFEDFYPTFVKTFTSYNFNHFQSNNQNQILTIFKNKIKCKFLHHNQTCNCELNNSNEFYYHLKEHLDYNILNTNNIDIKNYLNSNDNINIFHLLNTGSIFHSFLFLLFKMNITPNLKSLSTKLFTDSTIFLKKDLHYNQFKYWLGHDNNNNENNENNSQIDLQNSNFTPPWVGITADSSLFSKTPILFDDGGIIVASGTTKIIDNDLVINPSSIVPYNENINYYTSNFLTPQVIGKPPNYDTIKISEINHEKSQKNDFLSMLYKLLNNLNINLNINNLTKEEENYLKHSQEIPTPKIIEVEYDFNVPKPNIKYKDYDFEIPHLNPIKNVLDYPIPVLNPLKDFVDIKIPEIIPEIKQSNILIPEIIPEINQFNISIPEITPQIKSTNISIPEIKTQVKSTNISIPEITPQIKSTNISIPEIKTQVKSTNISIPEINPEIKQTKISIPEIVPNVSSFMLNIPYPNIQYQPTKVDLNVPQFNTKTNNVDVNINIPQIHTNNQNVKIDIPNFITTNFDHNINIPSFKVNKEDIIINVPNFIFNQQNPPQFKTNNDEFSSPPKTNHIDTSDLYINKSNMINNINDNYCKVLTNAIKDPIDHLINSFDDFSASLIKDLDSKLNHIVYHYNLNKNNSNNKLLIDNIINLDFPITNYNNDDISNQLISSQDNSLTLSSTQCLTQCSTQRSSTQNSSTPNSSTLSSTKSSTQSSATTTTSQDSNDPQSSTSLPSSQTLNISSIPLSSNNYNNNNINNNSDDDNNNHDDENNTQNSTSMSQNQNLKPIDLLNDFKNINNLNELKSTINKWKSLLNANNRDDYFNMNDWHTDPDPASLPLLNNFVISNEWPGENKFICPHCLEYSANTFSSITLHIKRVHNNEEPKYGFWVTNVISKLTGKLNYYVCESHNNYPNNTNNNTINQNKYAIDNIFPCLCNNCNKFVCTKANLHSHLKSHPDLYNKIKSLGMFWGTICHWAKNDLNLKPNDILRDMKGIKCPICNIFYTNMKEGFKHHITNNHPEIRKQNIFAPVPIHVKFSHMINHDEEDEEDINLINEFLFRRNRLNNQDEYEDNIININNNIEHNSPNSQSNSQQRTNPQTNSQSDSQLHSINQLSNNLHTHTSTTQSQNNSDSQINSQQNNVLLSNSNSNSNMSTLSSINSIQNSNSQSNLISHTNSQFQTNSQNFQNSQNQSNPNTRSNSTSQLSNQILSNSNNNNITTNIINSINNNRNNNNETITHNIHQNNHHQNNNNMPNNSNNSTQTNIHSNSQTLDQLTYNNDNFANRLTQQTNHQPDNRTNSQHHQLTQSDQSFDSPRRSQTSHSNQPDSNYQSTLISDTNSHINQSQTLSNQQNANTLNTVEENINSTSTFDVPNHSQNAYYNSSNNSDNQVSQIDYDVLSNPSPPQSSNPDNELSPINNNNNNYDDDIIINNRHSQVSSSFDQPNYDILNSIDFGTQNQLFSQSQTVSQSQNIYITEMSNLNNSKYNYLDREILCDKALNWISKNEGEEEKNISFPRLTYNLRKKISTEIHNLFEKDILALSNLINTESDNPDEWIITEGILCKINILIRKKLRTLLRIPLRRMLRNKRKKNYINSNDSNKFTKIVSNIFNLQELIDMILLLKDIIGETDTPKKRNKIANLETNIMNTLQLLPEPLTSHIFPNRSIDNIKDFLNDTEEHFQSKIEWLNATLDKNITDFEKKKNKGYQNIIRNMYREDPSRCASWYINNNISPECNISPETFASHFEHQWDINGNFDPLHELINYHETFDDDLRSKFTSLLLDKELINKSINKKSNVSASGRDGLSYAIWKMNNKVSTKLIRRLIKSFLTHKKIPESWKHSKTIMLFKKGNADETKSWRPIALTPTIYRIIMSHFANCFQIVNSLSNFINISQKGFKAGINGCTEHIITINEILAHANRNNKEVQILTIDFADAFGSIAHQHIIHALTKIGFPHNFCEVIKFLYKDNDTIISVNGNTSNPVKTNRGVRQGCPLSPLLFNICLNPLLEALKAEHINDGYIINNNSFSVQAFADDVILIANSVEALKRMLGTCEEFCRATGMTINPSKCQWLSYTIENNRRIASGETISLNNEQIKPLNINEAILYLGAPISTNKQSKMNITLKLLSEIKIEIQKITRSPLAITQIIDAIKRLITPKLDFIMLNGITPQKKIQELDKFIRTKLLDKLKSRSLPIDYFYTHWSDGGLSLKCLEERSQNLQLKTLFYLLNTKDESLINLINTNILEETNRRHIKEATSNDSNFINYDIYNINYNGSTKTNTIFTRGMYAAKKLNLNLFYDSIDDLLNQNIDSENDSNNNNNIADTNNLLKTIFIKRRNCEDLIKTNIQDLLNVLNSLNCEEHYNNLIKHDFKGHTFFDTKDSKHSNSFISNNKFFLPDCVTKFVINARCNSLPTNELFNKKDKNISKICSICNSNSTDSLMHRLNNCKPKSTEYTKRHNYICEILHEAIAKSRSLNYNNNSPIIHENSTVRLLGFNNLPDRSRILKPDIWFLSGDSDNQVINIVEVTCPYGGHSDITVDNNQNSDNNELISKLKLRRNEKLNKYNVLIKDIKDNWHIKANLYIVIVSSLGVIPKDSLTDLKRLLKLKNFVSSVAKKCVAASIIGSFNIFYNAKLSYRLHDYKNCGEVNISVVEGTGTDLSQPLQET